MIFCMDFGLKRIGLALFLNNIVIPLQPILRKNRIQASSDLQKVFLQYTNDISTITLIVGIPYNTDSDTTTYNEEMKRRIEHFLHLIEFSGTLIYMDESFSSKEAQEQLYDRNYKIRQNARKNGKLDSLSACVILERYLEHQNNLQAQQQTQQTHRSTQKNIAKPIIPQNKNFVIQQKDSPHIPVLLNHVLETFDMVCNPNNPNFIPKKFTTNNTKHIDSKNYIIDCTLGFGGMSSALLNTYPNIHLIGIDRDQDAIQYNKTLIQEFSQRFQINHGEFGSTLPKIIESLQNNNSQIKGILADIGVSSYQLDNLDRGFSFHANNLDMRMDKTQNLQASTILHSYGKYELERIFKDYGEIREYKKLTNLIIQERSKGEITNTTLQNIALKISSKGKLHPATLIYQALRIEVNDELGQLQKLLCTCKNLKGTLLCLISFHSLEDRIIKHSFKEWAKNCICDATSFKCTCGNNHAKGFSLYKKPLTATERELHSNPRSRSAKLRAFYFYE